MEVSIQIENNFSKLINYQILHVETQNTFRSRERATSGAPCPALTFVLSRVYIYVYIYTHIRETSDPRSEHGGVPRVFLVITVHKRNPDAFFASQETRSLLVVARHAGSLTAARNFSY